LAEPISFKIEGADELFAKMATYPQRFLDKGTRNALSEGAEVIRKEISARSLVLTGFEQDHVAKRVTVSTKSDRAEALVGWVKKAYYAMFSEFGTKNQPAHPVMRPAFETTKNAAMQKVIDKLRDTFNEVFHQ